MKVLSFVIGLVFVLLAVFTAVNWSALTHPTPLSFVVFSIQGPLGVILLGVTLLLVLLVVAYSLMLRTSGLVESRRLHRQLDEQRELADRAEASRLKELRELIVQELETTRTAIKEVGASAAARTEQAETELSRTYHELSNTILAHIGYVDDKLDPDRPRSQRPDE